MLFNLDFANKIILLCFFFFFLIIDLYFLIPASIAQILNTIAELVIPIGMLSKEAKEKIEKHPVIREAKIVQYNLELYEAFCVFYSSIHFALFFQGNSLLERMRMRIVIE